MWTNGSNVFDHWQTLLKFKKYYYIYVSPEVEYISTTAKGVYFLKS